MQHTFSKTKHIRFRKKHTHAVIKKWDIYVAIFIYALMITDLFRKMNDLWLHLPANYVEYLRNFIYITLFFLIMIELITHNKLKEPLLITLVFVFLVIFSLFTHTNIDAFIFKSILLFFSRVLPAYCIARFTIRWAGTLLLLNRLKWLMIIYSLIIIIFPETSSKNYMTLSYNLLVPTSVLLCEAVLKKKKINWVFSIPALMVLFVYGARGPIFCLLASLIFAWYCLIRTTLNYKKLFMLISLSITVLLLFLYKDIIIDALYGLFPQSRTLMVLKFDRFWDAAGRDNFYSTVFSELILHPFKFRGIFADSIYLSTQFNADISDGVYVHNFFLEVLFDFGVPLGFAILCGWLYLQLRSLKHVIKSLDNDLIIVYAVFAIGAIPQMMVSGSFVSSYSTWLGFGIIMNVIARHKKRVKMKNRRNQGHLFV